MQTRYSKVSKFSPIDAGKSMFKVQELSLEEADVASSDLEV